jgi:hypothetical protein
VHSQLQALNIFLASPGDLVEERKIARLVVEELNNSIGRPLGWRIELYGWEDSPIGIVRPQSQINEEVNQCDLFVGLLWERWGHPPGESHYGSGFEEELELAKNRWSRGGRPQIWLFLKDIDPKLLKYPGDQTKLVLEFRQKTTAEQKLFYKEFRNADEWTSEFRKRLSHYLVSLFRLTGVSERKRLIDALLEKTTFYYDVIYWLDRLSYPTKKWQFLFAESLSKHLNRPYRRDWLGE